LTVFSLVTISFAVQVVFRQVLYPLIHSISPRIVFLILLIFKKKLFWALDLGHHTC
jgi:hypothetical protein